MSYFVLWQHEDGLHIDQFTKEELVLRFSDGETFRDIEFHKDLRDTYELLEICNQSIIIKDEIVTPFEKEVVTKYDIK